MYSAPAGYTTGARWPMSDESGLKNSAGSSGVRMPSSSAWSAKLRASPTTLVGSTGGSHTTDAGSCARPPPSWSTPSLNVPAWIVPSAANRTRRIAGGVHRLPARSLCARRRRGSPRGASERDDHPVFRVLERQRTPVGEHRGTEMGHDQAFCLQLRPVRHQRGQVGMVPDLSVVGVALADHQVGPSGRLHERTGPLRVAGVGEHLPAALEAE